MRDPVFPTAPAPSVRIISGNQYTGDGNQGNQLQDGSAVLFRANANGPWIEQPLLFLTALLNNKYFAADVPTAALNAGDNPRVLPPPGL